MKKRGASTSTFILIAAGLIGILFVVNFFGGGHFICPYTEWPAMPLGFILADVFDLDILTPIGATIQWAGLFYVVATFCHAGWLRYKTRPSRKQLHIPAP